MRRRDRRADFRAGIVAIVLTALASYWAFGQPHPLRDRFQLKAVVTSVSGVTPGITPVRVAGVDVGEVTAIKSFGGTGTALLSMEIERGGLPLHRDARVKMRPRLFLEGNTFVDLSPGTPAAPRAGSGMTIPLERTSVAVTMPHVLGALTADTRTNLQDALSEYGKSLNALPTPAQDATQDQAVKRLSGGRALNGALHDAADAMTTSAQLSDDWTGRSGKDLDLALRGFTQVARGLDDAGPELGQMLASLRGASAAFASESSSVTSTLQELPRALDASRTALLELRRALPPARALALATTTALPRLPAALRSGTPWLREFDALLGRRELGGDLDSLVPATRQLAPALQPTSQLFDELDLLARCGSKVLIPTANTRIDDGPRSAGSSSWSEFLSALVGGAGVAGNFDGNGYMLRGNPGGGASPVASGKTRWLGQPAYGNALSPPLGTRPAKPAALPSHDRSLACERNAAPALNGPAAATGAPDGSGR
jgi:phospholipid/cholesterol/gamma-HCH transport system substrate-binding protein